MEACYNGIVSSKTKSADTVHSPNWPVGYPTNKDCYWKITVGDNHGIKIAIMDFEMNYDMDCNDKVKVKGLLNLLFVSMH